MNAQNDKINVRLKLLRILISYERYLISLIMEPDFETGKKAKLFKDRLVQLYNRERIGNACLTMCILLRRYMNILSMGPKIEIGYNPYSEDEGVHAWIEHYLYSVEGKFLGIAISDPACDLVKLVANEHNLSIKYFHLHKVPKKMPPIFWEKVSTFKKFVANEDKYFQLMREEHPAHYDLCAKVFRAIDENGTEAYKYI